MPGIHLRNNDSEDTKMENFDKRKAMAVIEDALSNVGIAYGRGMATGLCGAFYLCGLFDREEWEACLNRIPSGPEAYNSSGVLSRILH
jgi:hypothetical protein